MTVGKRPVGYHSLPVSISNLRTRATLPTACWVLDVPRTLLPDVRERCTAIFYGSRSAFSAASYWCEGNDWRNSFGLALHCTGSIRNYHFEAGLANGIAMARSEKQSCCIV